MVGICVTFTLSFRFQQNHLYLVIGFEIPHAGNTLEWQYHKGLCAVSGMRPAVRCKKRGVIRKRR